MFAFLSSCLPPFTQTLTSRAVISGLSNFIQWHISKYAMNYDYTQHTVSVNFKAL